MSRIWEDPRLGDSVARQLETRRLLLGEGHRRIGWKIGLGAPEARKRLRIAEGVIGHLTSATVIADGAAVPVGHWTQPALEPELAIFIGMAVDAGADEDETARSIYGLGAAIELADIDEPPDDLARVVAGNVYHRGVVLGRVNTAFAGGATQGINVDVCKGDELIGTTGDPTRLTGDLVALVRLTAGWLHAAGEALMPGDVIIAGSTLPPIPVAPGDRLTYACSPLGSLTVRLTD